MRRCCSLRLGLVYQSWARSFVASVSADIHSVACFSASFFGVFSVLQLLAVVLLGPAMVAGTVASERERRTIEYLFASSLSNSEIVLGKLAARMIHVIYMILAGVPILALMMLLGGIAPEALLALTIITLCTVLTVSTLSIAVSVWSTRAREAVTRTYLVLFVLLVLPGVVLGVLSATGAADTSLVTILEPFIEANPFAILFSVIATASGQMRGVAMDIVYVFVRNQLILSAVLATAATLAVRRTHLRQRGKGAKRRSRLSQRFRPAVSERPMFWKEVFAEPAASRLGWIGRIATVLIVIVVVGLTVYFFTMTVTSTSPYRRRGEEYFGFAIFMGVALACGGLLLVASRAAGSITSEKERDCWTSLISTPLEPGEIVWAKIAGSVWSIRGLVMLLLLILGLGLLLDPKFIIPLGFMFGHVPGAGVLRRGDGRAVLAVVPQLASGDGRHAGHRHLRRRSVLLLLHAAADSKWPRRR